LLSEVEGLLRSHPDLQGRREVTVPYITRCYRATAGPDL
jgi:hypothetical protein